jgi:hypothetical protein
MSGEFCITVPGVDPARSVIIAQPDEWAWVPSGAGVRLPWAHYSSRSGYCPAGAFLVETGTVAPGTEDYYGAVYHWNEPFVFMVA